MESRRVAGHRYDPDREERRVTGWPPDCSLLILEDEPMIMMDLEFVAGDRGCAVVCATGVSHALELLAGDARICGAVLDVNLGRGETCLPVARELESRGIPYVLHSGDLNRQDELVRQLGATHVAKPASAERVIRIAIEAACSNGG